MAATLDNTADGTAGIVLERPCNSRPNHPTDVTAQSPAPACGTHAPGLAGRGGHEPSPEKSPQEVLAGVVERVTYHNVENGFCVLWAKARGHRDVVTVVGHAATIAAGEWITASGEWVLAQVLRVHAGSRRLSLFFSQKQGDFPRKTGRRLSTNGQSLRGIRDLDNFSKSK